MFLTFGRFFVLLPQISKMQKNMKKKHYTMPTVQAVKIQHRKMLMTSPNTELNVEYGEEDW